MLLIYTHRITSRNKYVFKLIFGDILGLKHELTADRAVFNSWKEARISYCRQAIADEPFFFATDLLFESGIVVQEPVFLTWNGNKVFYPTIRNSSLPFDPFAAAFFLVSRYEEYLPHMRDNHGRFESKQSLAYLHGFLQKPVVNHWAIEILHIIESKFGKQITKERHYSFRPTVDIDNAWAYRHKGFIRIGGGMLTDLFNLNFESFLQRFRAVFHLANDPYDTYEYQIELIERYQLKPIFFILLGDYATFDKNVPHQNKHMQSLIKYLGDFGDVGIHPSYASNNQPKKLPNEISRLAYILHQEIHLSRQHFLRLSLPETYQRLIENDITDDYTMGYPDQAGFRAGICNPYFFYDLDLEIETALRLHPFAIMDGTLRDYMNISPDEAADIINPLIEEVKNVKGEFISVWHNESFAENARWKGWKKVYEDMIEKAIE